MLVGICGKAGAGKDTIGDYLIQKRKFKKIALADPLKRMVKDVFVLDDHTVYDRIEREKPLEKWPEWTVRKLLQYIGTELFRENIDDAVWVKSLWYRISGDKNSNYVVTDIRFPNELDFFNKNAANDFVSIKVTRDGCDGHVGLKSNWVKSLLYKIIRKDNRHASEAYDLDTKHVIDNNGSFEDLYAKIEAILKEENYGENN